jgi:hypothetical protein
LSQREVFEVATVDQAGNDPILWRVQDRAYEDVKIGDKLYLDVTSPDEAGSHLTFQFIGRRSHGVDLPGMDHGMSGEIVLKGPHGDLLREDDVLLAK